MLRVWCQVYLEFLEIRAICLDPSHDPGEGVTEGLPQHRDTGVADSHRSFPRP